MMRPSKLYLSSRLLLAVATGLLAATGTASAQSRGTGGCAFWATEVNDSCSTLSAGAASCRGRVACLTIVAPLLVDGFE